MKTTCTLMIVLWRKRILQQSPTGWEPLLLPTSFTAVHGKERNTPDAVTCTRNGQR